MRAFGFIFGAAALLLLAGCGGHEPATQAGILDYAPTASTRHSYTPYVTGSHGFAFNGEITIGGELEPREQLRHVATENDIRYFMGASRDGVGVDRLENYESDLLARNGSFRAFTVAPELYFDPDILNPENAGLADALYDSILLLNDALPPEFQILIRGTRDTDVANAGEIMVNLESSSSVSLTCGTQVVACATFPTGNVSKLYLPDDFDTSEYSYPRSVIVHELLHALGIKGHVDSIEFPDSIMGTAGEHIPNLGHILSRIDREVLQILYMSQRTDLYNDWGEWSDTTFHLVGRSEDGGLNFGVALFNGLPQPWVKGASPVSFLADNNSLSGTANWLGSLLGYSGPSPIAGDVELEVDLATLADVGSEQDLRFRDIFFLNRFENSDLSDSSDRWFDTRDIDYKIAVSGNAFSNVSGEGYEGGLITGAFLGIQHEHMAGTVKRTDMVGAFGGSRE